MNKLFAFLLLLPFLASGQNSTLRDLPEVIVGLNSDFTILVTTDVTAPEKRIYLTNLFKSFGFDSTLRNVDGLATNLTVWEGGAFHGTVLAYNYWQFEYDVRFNGPVRFADTLTFTNALVYGDVTFQAPVMFFDRTYVFTNFYLQTVPVSKLLRTDSNHSVSEVTIGNGVSFNGTTIAIDGIVTNGLRADVLNLQGATNALNGARPVVLPNTNATLTAGSYTNVLRDAVVYVGTGSARTNWLNSATAANGTLRWVKDLGTASGTNLVIKATSGNIDGQASYTISANYGAVLTQWDGTNWWLLSKF